jgi:hypothetical protein
MTAAKARCIPGHRRAGERCSRRHEGKDDRALARALDIFARAFRDRSNATLGLGRRKPGHSRDEAHQIGAVLGQDAAMARSAQQDAGGFGAKIVDAVAWRPALSTEQPVEIERDDVFTRDRCGGTRPRARRRL